MVIWLSVLIFAILKSNFKLLLLMYKANTKTNL